MLNINTKEKLRNLLNDDAKTAAFAETIIEMFQTDDETFEDIGKGIIYALLNNDADALLNAVCGWSADSILRFIVGDK